MSSSWIIPHQQLLTQQFQQNTLPHALIFSGVKGAGKKMLSQWLSQVFCCQNTHISEQQIIEPCRQCKACLLFTSGNFPDHSELVREKNTLGVDIIRQATQFLQKTAQMSGYKSVLIPEAHLMTESAANALLKTLEEPSNNSHIILLTSDIERLLPTIISRCRVIDIRPNVGKKLNDELAIESLDNFTNLSHLNELQSQEKLASFTELTQVFCLYLTNQSNRQSLTRLLVADEDHTMRWLEKILVDLMRQLNGWQTALAPNLLSQLNTGNISYHDVYQCYKIFLQSQQQLVNLVQANKNMVIEKMLIAFHQHLSASSIEVINE
ncbi:MAG: DNA polymerase III subunit delta' [Thalassotalea sp.]